MKRLLYFPLTAVLLFLAINAHAQTVGKIEVQAQFTSLSLIPPDSFFVRSTTEPGFGGRVVFNLNDNFALEGEGNFFPNKNVFNALGEEGRAVQGQFGVKAGKRFRKFGIFAKARPGFLSIDNVFSYDGTFGQNFGFTSPNFGVGRKNYFTMDLGGVLEFYPSKKTVVRFDAGHTFVRFGPRLDVDFPNFPQLITLPAKTTHRLQLSSAVGFRLGNPGNRDAVANSGGVKDTLPKLEIGIHFASLSVSPPTELCFVCSVNADRGPITNLGLGARFTYNLTRNLALEAEGNYFTHDQENFSSVPGGHLYQGLFGAKIGKRFAHFGVFGKARPGFTGFSQVFQLTATHVGNFFGRSFTFGDFGTGRKLYFTTDVGGVLEFYVSRRVMTRMDFGDTIIRYGEAQAPGFSVSLAILRRPPETRHNLQFNAGVGFRF
jgi:hypothetical protein